MISRYRKPGTIVICTECNNSLPLKHTTWKDGIRNEYCKKCYSKIQKQKYRNSTKGKEKQNQIKQEEREAINGLKGAERFFKLKYNQLKDGTKSRNKNKETPIPFKLNKDAFVEWGMSRPFKCYYCGLDFKKISMDRKRHDRLSIDRVNNDKGYDIKNIVFCCYLCNMVKNDYFTHDEMVDIGNTINKVRNKRMSFIKKVAYLFKHNTNKEV